MSDPDPLTLAEAAEELGVHYMTAYRYVRTGRLAATQVGRTWQVTRDALHEFVSTATAPAGPRATSGGRRPPRAIARLERRLLAGDEAGSWKIIEDALTGGAQPSTVHLELIGPALRSIGERWQHDQVSIAEEHRATAVAQRLIARLGPRFRRPGRRRGTIVVGAASGDFHALPVAIAADLLRSRSFDVIDLGADVPAASFGEAARSTDRLRAVVVSASTDAAARELSSIVDAIGDVPILAGGAGLSSAGAVDSRIQLVTLEGLVTFELM